MCDVADAGQSLPAKAVSANRRQVLEGFQFGSCKPLAQDRQIIFLRRDLALLQFSSISKGHER